MLRSRPVQIVLIAWLVVYVTSYLWLSRRGYAEAERWNMRGFYYLTPRNTDEWRMKNYTLAQLYEPINTIDQLLGTGRPPACEPMWELKL